MEKNNVLYFDFVSPYKGEKSQAGKSTACNVTYEYYDKHQPRFIDYEIPR